MYLFLQGGRLRTRAKGVRAMLIFQTGPPCGKGGEEVLAQWLVRPRPVSSLLAHLAGEGHASR